MKSHPSREFQGTDRFVIRRRIGAGGMGVVYEAYDRKRSEVVALKILQQKRASDIYRFKREFRALTDLVHPNVVSLYELLGEGDSWFFTMELVRGVNFLEHVFDAAAGHSSVSTEEDFPSATGPSEQEDEQKTRNVRPPILAGRKPEVNLDRLRSALTQLAEGVSALHAAGKLHRDIKPSNVLVTPEGRVVLLDFGLVKEYTFPDADESATLIGTPAYMSPEQMSGGSVSEASDWYAVGVMLFQALTGELPFTGGKVFEMVTRKLHSSPPAPATIVPGVPEDLDHLCQDLLRTDPNARPAGKEILQFFGQFPKTEIPRNTAPPSLRVPLVGRKLHLAKLTDALSLVKEGKTVAACVHGRSGIGKTTLIRRFLEDARERNPDLVVLQGRCFEQESVPYKALDSLMDALTQYLKRFSTRAAEALMPRHCAALARLFPAFHRVDSVAMSRWRVFEIPDPQELRRRAFAALRELLSRMADRWPLVLYIDDLQWGDVDSVALLAELLRPPDAPAFLLIVSYRTEEAQTSPVLKSFLTSLSGFAATDVREIVVGELVLGEARNLALALLDRQRAGLEDQAIAIARESGGSPLFIVELARHVEEARIETALAASADISLDEMIHRRVQRLPEGARRLLEVIAVAGQPLELGIAKQAAGLAAEEHVTINVLRSGHLIRTRDRSGQEEIETYHDRIRETVCAHIEERQLRRYHEDLASALETSSNADAETLAVHHTGAGNSEKAAKYSSLAAAQASEAFAFDRAARLYQQALQLRPDRDRESGSIRIKLGDALAKAGRGAEAAAAYLKASEKAKGAEALELRRQAAEQLLRSGHVDEGLSVLRTVLGSMGMKLAKTPMRALASLLMGRIYARWRGTAFRERDAAQIPAGELTRVDTCWSVGVGLSMVDVIRGADFQVLHLLQALKVGEPARIARALATEAPYIATVGVSAIPRAQKLLQEAELLAERLKQPDAFGRARLAAGITAYLTGQWKRAVEFTSSAEQIFREECTGVAWERNTAHHFRLMSCIALGEWREIAQQLPTLLKEAEERGDLLAEANLGVRMSYLMLLADDETERAQEQWREGLMTWSNQGFHTQHYYDVLRQGEIALYSSSARTGWDFLTSRWGPMSRSLILRIQVFRIEATHLRARIALAAVTQGAGQMDVAPFIASARKDAGYLAREKTLWARALSQLVLAGLSSIQGQLDETLNLLASAEESFNTTDMALYAAATRRCRGLIIRGSEGSAQVRLADDWMRSQKIKNPERITAMLVPGLYGNSKT